MLRERVPALLRAAGLRAAVFRAVAALPPAEPAFARDVDFAAPELFARVAAGLARDAVDLRAPVERLAEVLRYAQRRLTFVLASTQRKEVIRCLMVQQGGRRGVFAGPRR